MKLKIAGWIAAAILGACVSAQAQTYPTREIRVVVGLPAGSGGDVVARFYAEESCGQCTPCREGTPWQARILRRIEEGRGVPEDLGILQNVATAIAPFPPIGLGNTICALGDAAALPVHSFLQKFRSEFERHIELKRCPFGERPWGHFGGGRS